jgi:radical SAM/Cys-rich protein
MAESLTPSPPPCIEAFSRALERCGLELRRDRATVLQVNVGFLCDLACRHCHLQAGPARTEVMSPETMEEVITYASRCRFQVIDITGGAPELVPRIDRLVSGLAPLASKLIFRTNLSALLTPGAAQLPELLRSVGAAIVASFPSANAGQAEAQRGRGIMEKSIAALKLLNGLGYGREGSGLELDLVANPTGAFLPPSQCEAERKFRRDLDRKYGVVFSHLYTFANVPLGRFRRWLEESGNLEGYLQRLAGSFNPATVPGLMCRTLVSVAWDGRLYDCDFNLAAGRGLGGEQRHVSRMAGLPAEEAPIPTDDYCYACTAGSGFT